MMILKARHPLILFTFLFLALTAGAVFRPTASSQAMEPRASLGSGFTYQGSLVDGGSPANGNYDFTFKLFDVASGGFQAGSTVSLNNVAVVNGLFTVVLDFGGLCAGTAYFLEVAVRPAGGGAYTTLAPRQPLTPAPYALYAPNAGAAQTAATAASATTAGTANAVPWAGITGMPGGFADGIDNDTIVTWSTLSGIPADLLDGDNDTIVTWGTLAGIPAGFADNVDNDTLGALAGCSVGQVAKWNGTAWVCAPDQDTDTNTTYSAGYGLGLSGTTFRVLTGTIQTRVSGACAAGFYMQSINANGSVTCAPDQDTDTTYTAGTGLTLSGGQFALTLAFRLPQGCSTGEIPAWNGTQWVCAADQDTTYTAGTGLGLLANQFSLAETYRMPQGCSLGQIPAWSGLGWICAADKNDTLFWSLRGNEGIDPNFDLLGTLDDAPLILAVNGTAALRLVPAWYDGDLTPNFVGGHYNNLISATAAGSAIFSGGSTNPGYGINQVKSSFSIIVGGYANQVNAEGGAILGGAGNAADGEFSFIGGGLNNQASKAFTGVAGGEQNTASADWAFVSGGKQNTSSQSYTYVGGGLTNSATATRAAVGGGESNQAGGSYAFAGGGQSNQATGSHSFNGGGQLNTASNTGAAIVGGYSNLASGMYAFNGGGYDNNALGDSAFVGAGGFAQEPASSAAGGNTASGDASVVVGGIKNLASGMGSFVGGGGFLPNVAVPGNQATNLVSAVVGGAGNVASGIGSFVGGGGLVSNFIAGNQASGLVSAVVGGYGNTASGEYSSVPGGRQNTASGDYSFAGGYRAEAKNQGSFVWADNSSSVYFSSTSDYQFLIRATGGVGINQNSPVNPLHVTTRRSNADNLLVSYVVQFENNTTLSDGDILALHMTNETTPGSTNNFITFFANSNPVGNIGGNGSGGVSYNTTGADFAEYLVKANLKERIVPGSIVGLGEKGVSLATEQSGQVYVASSSPGFVGNNGPGREDDHVLVAMMGQANVRVLGQVQAGDWIIPSGRNDGTGLAVSLDELTPAQAGQIVGQALEGNSSAGEKMILALVGQPRDAAWAQLLVEKEARLADLENRLVKLEQAMSTGQPAGFPWLWVLAGASLAGLFSAMAVLSATLLLRKKPAGQVEKIN